MVEHLKVGQRIDVYSVAKNQGFYTFHGKSIADKCFIVDLNAKSGSLIHLETFLHPHSLPFREKNECKKIGTLIITKLK